MSEILTQFLFTIAVAVAPPAPRHVLRPGSLLPPRPHERAARTRVGVGHVVEAGGPRCGQYARYVSQASFGPRRTLDRWPLRPQIGDRTG
jgi:hypothetical protein